MTKVVKEDIKKAALDLGVKEGDILLVHSSFKSLGEVEGGAETVIKGFLESIGEEGTLVFPTFCQKEFHKAYETWHLDKESDVGYLTNYFRKREGSLRSDQATHSVAAAGKKAQWLTETHGHTHKRFGDMGDTPFSNDSPWEKMYNENAKVIGLGVSPLSFTFRHYAEYVFIERCLEKLAKTDKYDEMKSRLHAFERTDRLYAWPRVFNEWIYDEMKKKGLTKETKCGNATLLYVEAKDFVHFIWDCLEAGEKDALWVIEEAWDVNEYLDWYEDFKKITE